MRFAGVELTPESIGATQRWFADNALHSLDDALSGRVRVNDLPGYVQWCRERFAHALTDAGTHSVAFAQRAYYLQTGESVALLFHWTQPPRLTGKEAAE